MTGSLTVNNRGPDSPAGPDSGAATVTCSSACHRGGCPCAGDRVHGGRSSCLLLWPLEPVTRGGNAQVCLHMQMFVCLCPMPSWLEIARTQHERSASYRLIPPAREWVLTSRRWSTGMDSTNKSTNVVWSWRDGLLRFDALHVEIGQQTSDGAVNFNSTAMRLCFSGVEFLTLPWLCSELSNFMAELQCSGFLCQCKQFCSAQKFKWRSTKACWQLVDGSQWN